MRIALTAVFVVLAMCLAANGQIITEFMADNKTTFTDKYGDYSDWIELYNPAWSRVDMLGWSLSDDVTDPTKWVFPAVELDAGEYLIVFASGKDRRDPLDELHTDFRLSAAGEYLGLFRPDGTVASDFAPAYPPQRPDVPFFSYGLSPLDGSLTVFEAPTPGWQNAPEPTTLLLLLPGGMAMLRRRRR